VAVLAYYRLLVAYSSFPTAYSGDGNSACWMVRVQRTSGSSEPFPFPEASPEGGWVRTAPHTSCTTTGGARILWPPPVSEKMVVVTGHEGPPVLIFYPPTRMLNGTARWTLGALPNNEAFIFPPEMLHAG
jgi:hypothetical protein